jgi:hypothetical protein
MFAGGSERSSQQVSPYPLRCADLNRSARISAALKGLPTLASPRPGTKASATSHRGLPPSMAVYPHLPAAGGAMASFVLRQNAEITRTGSPRPMPTHALVTKQTCNTSNQQDCSVRILTHMCQCFDFSAGGWNLPMAGESVIHPQICPEILAICYKMLQISRVS